VRTRVGYCGGTKAAPTYHSLGDHTETTEIDFDPSKVSYAELLDVFWATHNPCARPYSRQYASVIFFHDGEQRRLALETKAREEARRGRKITTDIVPYERFWIAEDYHQKYYLRGDDELLREFHRLTPTNEAFVHSTAAARVNGFLGGHALPGRLEREGPKLGLSPEGLRRLAAYGAR
jgi:methionine-S-sulfoxide reductase